MKNQLFVRLLLVNLVFALVLSFASAQDSTNLGENPINLSTSQNAQSLRPNVIMTITEDKSTAELVEITMVDANFPRKVLEQIVSNFGIQTGIQPRGVMIETDEITQGQLFLKAKFGINGLIEPGMGEIRLEQIAKAFVGLPAGTQIKNIQIMLPGLLPSSQSIKYHANAYCDVQGTFSRNPQGLEYLIRLRTTDATKISIPPKVLPEKKENKKNEQKSEPNRLSLYGLVGLAALAAGFLVYLLFVKGQTRA